MKQLLILSGKGGTGKTTVSGAFVRLSLAKACADCDVDAPNLHLLLGFRSEPEKSEFFGLPKAGIDPALCDRCGKCVTHCRFDAVKPEYSVDPYACEGCGVCRLVCPAGAVTMEPAAAGELEIYTGEDRVFSTAELYMGSGNSGMLVSEVKKRMQEAAPPGADFAVIDGSPGIGCPVIASVSGVDMALIVAEPTASGISDMERILKTAGIFAVNTAVCVNKFDVNPAYTERIKSFCLEKNIPVVGVIPYDPAVVEITNRGKTVAEIDCPAGRAVKQVYRNTIDLLFPGGPA